MSDKFDFEIPDLPDIGDAAPAAKGSGGAKGGGKPPRGFLIAHGVVKTLAIVVGLPLTVLSLMSIVGLVSDNFWIRLIPAVIVALAPPLFLIDRLLPDEGRPRAPGLITDVLALCWLGFAVAFIGLAQPLTGSLIAAEAERYDRGGSSVPASLTYWLSGEPRSRTAESGADAADGGTAGDAGAADGAVTDG